MLVAWCTQHVTRRSCGDGSSRGAYLPPFPGEHAMKQRLTRPHTGSYHQWYDSGWVVLPHIRVHALTLAEVQVGAVLAAFLARCTFVDDTGNSGGICLELVEGES